MMSTRSKTSICLEGWYYLFIVFFVIGGAVLGEVNLLVVLGGMMVGPMLFNWQMVKLMVRDVRVERQVPDRACCGESVPIGIVAHNTRRRVASWMLVVEDRVIRQGIAESENEARVRLMLPRVKARQTAAIEYRLLVTQRGRYEFPPLRWSTRFPLGLVRSRCLGEVTQRLLVRPRQGRLSHRWSGIVHARQTGNQSDAQRRGTLEGDYYGLREWRPGDSKRWIHWRTSARLGELAVRQFEQQRNRNLVLVLDLWQPSAPTTEERVCAEIAISFLATAVSHACQQGGGRLTISVAGRDIRHWAGTASPLMASEILDYLAETTPGDGLAIHDVMQRARSQRRPGTPSVVISTRGAPFLTNQDAWQHPTPAGDVSLGDVAWIDCRSEQRKQYFHLADIDDEDRSAERFSDPTRRAT